MENKRVILYLVEDLDKEITLISPYLFLIVVVGLFYLISKANREGCLSVISVSNGPVVISHFLFADDNLIFCIANEKELVALKNILKLYGDASGECINFNKSSILFSKKS